MEDSMKLLTAIRDSQNISTLLDHLPSVKWLGVLDLYQWEGFWYFPSYLEAAIAFRSHFEARGDDVILASSFKTGTTWLKALVSCIMYCCQKEDDCDAYVVVDDDVKDPLTKNGPHAVIKGFEAQIYKENPAPNLSDIPSPRLFHTHMPYQSLPQTVKDSKCKIVYITRNPKDTFVSMWHFMNSTRTPEMGPIFPMEEPFNDFCNGIYPMGPFFDSVLGYWKESLERPDKMLFLKYEEMRNNPRGQVKKLASFLGRPLLSDEEADKVLQRCSLERLKNLEVNKYGVDSWSGIANSAFFRTGTVGDWKNYFTPEMTERLNRITRSKLEGSDLNL